MINTISTAEKSFKSIPEAEDYLNSRNTQDFICSGARLSAIDDGGKAVLAVKGNTQTKVFPMRETGLERLLQKTGLGTGSIPSKVFDNKQLIWNINYLLWNQLADKKYTVRLEDGEFKALMSDEYSPISHQQTLKLAGRLADGYEVEQCYLTKDFFRVSIVNPNNLVEPQVGDISKLGTDLINSETGAHSLNVASFIYRLWCSNGASRREAEEAARAIHRRLDVTAVLRKFAVVARRHLTEGAEILQKKMQFLISKNVDEKYLNNVKGRTQIAIGKGNMEKLVDEWGKKIGVTDYDPIKCSNIEKCDPTRYELVNLITKTAHRDFNGERRIKMERLGGALYEEVKLA